MKCHRERHFFYSNVTSMILFASVQRVEGCYSASRLVRRRLACGQGHSARQTGTQARRLRTNQSSLSRFPSLRMGGVRGGVCNPMEARKIFTLFCGSGSSSGGCAVGCRPMLHVVSAYTPRSIGQNAVLRPPMLNAVFCPKLCSICRGGKLYRYFLCIARGNAPL